MRISRSLPGSNAQNCATDTRLQLNSAVPLCTITSDAHFCTQGLEYPTVVYVEDGELDLRSPILVSANALVCQTCCLRVYLQHHPWEF